MSRNAHHILTRRALLASRLRRTYASPANYQPETDPQLDGYPQLPEVSRQYLHPKGWWDTQMRRNFGDTLHERDEVLSMWGPDVPVVPPQTALFQFTLVALGFVTFGFLAKGLVADKPAAPREYPFSRLVTELGGIEENKARAEDESEDE